MDSEHQGERPEDGCNHENRSTSSQERDAKFTGFTTSQKSSDASNSDGKVGDCQNDKAKYR